MDAKPSISKSELSDTIDNFIKEEQKEVQFVSVYEKISNLNLNSSRKGMQAQRRTSHAGSLRMPHLQCAGWDLRLLLA